MLYAIITSLFCIEAPQDFINRDQLKNGCLISSHIEMSSIWPTLAKVPSFHPYTDYLAPCSIIALETPVPQDLQGIITKAFFHAQTVPEPEKEQLMRLHAYTHPQGVGNYNLSAVITLSPFSGSQKPVMQATGDVNTHPGQTAEQAISISVASPNNFRIDGLDWNQPQKFISTCQIAQEKIFTLHVTAKADLGFYLAKKLGGLSQEEHSLQEFLKLRCPDNPEIDENLTFIQEAYKVFWQ